MSRGPGSRRGARALWLPGAMGMFVHVRRAHSHLSSTHRANHAKPTTFVQTHPPRRLGLLLRENLPRARGAARAGTASATPMAEVTLLLLTLMRLHLPFLLASVLAWGLTGGWAAAQDAVSRTRETIEKAVLSTDAEEQASLVRGLV